MSRSTRPLLFAGLLALFAVSASAGPDDPFDSRVPGALKPGQVERILALESGRYSLKGGFFLDARAADPKRPLTQGRVAELLREGENVGADRSERLVASINEATQRMMQRALDSLFQGRMQPADFDGSIPRPEEVARTAAPFGGGELKAPTTRLAADLLQRVAIVGSREEREAIGAALENILKTKSGRRQAERFVREGARAAISFDDIDARGATQPGRFRSKVLLNRKYLTDKDGYPPADLAGTLAHELFGHALQKLTAANAGLSDTTLRHYRGGEMESRLIDWLVEMELTGEVEQLSQYLDDPEGYYRTVLTWDPYYVTTLGPEEMKAPLPSLRERRRLIDRAEARTRAVIRDWESWRPVIAHFRGKKHRIPMKRLERLQRELEDAQGWYRRHLANIPRIREALEKTIAQWASPEGAGEMKELTEAASKPYVRELEARQAEYVAELRRLSAEGVGELPVLSGAMIENIPEPGEKPIDMDELRRLHKEDKMRHPEHWR